MFHNNICTNPNPNPARRRDGTNAIDYGAKLRRVQAQAAKARAAVRAMEQQHAQRARVRPRTPRRPASKADRADKADKAGGGSGRASNYEPVRELGAGTFGTVVLCTDRTTGTAVVVKTVDAFTGSSKLEARNEVRMLRKLTHPYIIRYIDSYTEGTKLNIVMEHAAGGDLDDRIKTQRKRRKYFSEKQVATWLCQLLLGLEYMHRNKVLHRDLKSKNVLLDSADNIKLADLGLSAALQHTLEQRRTRTGTPLTMSPELITGTKYNASADMWSLGCIIYQVMGLRMPFQGKNMIQLSNAILAGSTSPLPSHYSSELRAVVTDLLQLDPNDRPSARDLLRRKYIRHWLHRGLGLGRDPYAKHAPTARSPSTPAATSPSTPAATSPSKRTSKRTSKHTSKRTSKRMAQPPHSSRPITVILHPTSSPAAHNDDDDDDDLGDTVVRLASPPPLAHPRAKPARAFRPTLILPHLQPPSVLTPTAQTRPPIIARGW